MSLDNNKVYDCAIAGGGLAGLSAAVLLAKAGKSVVLFEKKKYPFHKVCGEYISMESWPFLERLGIALGDMDLPRIKKLKISSPSGRIVESNLPLGGFGISRYMLDGMLAKKAIEEGVNLTEQYAVKDIRHNNDLFIIGTNSETFISKTACGAYGKRGEPDVKMQRDFIQHPSPYYDNYIGVKYHIRTDFPKDRIELHNFKDGYCGISAVEDDKYCLCYLTTAKNIRENGNDIKTAEENILYKNPYLKRYFTESEFLFKNPEVISQISFAKKSAVENRIFMVGDTSGMIAPLCGNGMSMALHGAKTAAELIELYLDKVLTRPQAESLYRQNLQDKFGARLYAGRIFQRLFGKEKVTDMTISLLAAFPALTSGLIRLTHGQAF